MTWCNNPVESRAMGVLLGFETAIRPFMELSDQRNLSRTTWWLYHLVGRTKTSQHASWLTDAQLQALTQNLHTRMMRGGIHRDTRKKTNVRLSVGQVRVVLRDLLLVASGLRPSCLVDCCALTKELVELLLAFLADEHELIQQWSDSKQVRAVMLDGNVFFVNVGAFVHEKMVELATGLNKYMYVDVSASLSCPHLVCSSSESGASRLKAFAVWTASACKDLVTSPSSKVLEWKRPSTFSAIAVAGTLLCYPCVYDIVKDNDVSRDDEWSEQGNNLAMCPLWLFQVSVLIPNEQVEMTLQEFSVPQHLLDNDSCFNKSYVSPLVSLLRTHCRLKLQRAIEQSCFKSTSIQPHVLVCSRMLHRVVL